MNTTLTKADATALWHAVDAMRWNLRAMSTMPDMAQHIPAERARFDAARAALRKVYAQMREARKAGKS